MTALLADVHAPQRLVSPAHQLSAPCIVTQSSVLWFTSISQHSTREIEPLRDTYREMCCMQLADVVVGAV